MTNQTYDLSIVRSDEHTWTKIVSYLQPILAYDCSGNPKGWSFSENVIGLKQCYTFNTDNLILINLVSATLENLVEEGKLFIL